MSADPMRLVRSNLEEALRRSDYFEADDTEVRIRLGETWAYVLGALTWLNIAEREQADA